MKYYLLSLLVAIPYSEMKSLDSLTNFNPKLFHFVPYLYLVFDSCCKIYISKC